MEHTNALIPSRPGLTAYVYADPLTLFIVWGVATVLLWAVYKIISLVAG